MNSVLTASAEEAAIQLPFLIVSNTTYAVRLSNLTALALQF